LGKNLHLLKQKKMKTKLILVLIMLIGFFQSAVAQDFSAFYQAIEGTAKAKYNDKTGCEFSSKDDLVFKPLTESTLDIRFEMKCLEKDAEDAIVYIRVGNEQQVEFEVSFKDGLTTKVNGEMIKNNYVAHEMSEEGSGNVEFHFDLRIAKDVVKPLSYGDFGGDNIIHQYKTDNPNIHIRTDSPGKIAIKLAIETGYMESLNVFAKSGLKLRETPDLKGKTLTTIPYGTEIYLLDDSSDAQRLFVTRGDLKVGDISSQMKNVLYDNKIGYVYGGYLLPFRQTKPAEANKEGDFNNWTGYSGMIAESAFYQKKLGFKKGIINFEDYNYESMDVSQWKYLLAEFFPNALTTDKIDALLKENKTHILKVKSGDYEENFEIAVDENKLQKVVYTKTLTGLLEKLAPNKNGYVVADNLNMRQSADASSEVITKIPFGALVAIVDNSAPFLVIGGVHGKMIKVKYNGKEGYVFDAYLSPTKPLELKKGSNAIASFDAILKAKSDTEWKHNGFGRMDVEWMMIPSRDKFQALKTLRKLCPELNDLSFKWNENTKDYEVEATSQRISIYEYEGQWIISVNDTKEDITTIITIETLTDNIQKVVIFKEEPGC